VVNAIRVLVVDDSSQFRQYLANLLAAIQGVEVVGTGADGFDALECAERLRPDVVMIDIQMPVLDGLEATRRLRRAASTSKILVMTCYDGAEYRAAARAAGADAFALKSRITSGLEHTLHVLTGRILSAPGCKPVRGFDSWGNPLSYDLIACR